jgi:hypothetical protein
MGVPTTTTTTYGWCGGGDDAEDDAERVGGDEDAAEHVPMPSSSSGRFARRQVLEENEDEFQAAIQKGDLEGLEARFGVMSYNTSWCVTRGGPAKESKGAATPPRGRASLEARFGAMPILEHVMVCHAPEGATTS